MRQLVIIALFLNFARALFASFVILLDWQGGSGI